MSQPSLILLVKFKSPLSLEEVMKIWVRTQLFLILENRGQNTVVTNI